MMRRTQAGQLTSRATSPPRHQVPEHDLASVVAAAQAGDPRATRHLFDQIEPWLTRQFGARPDHPAHGDQHDAVQDACERVLRGLPRYHGRTTRDVQLWLANIVHNTRTRRRTLLDRDLSRYVLTDDLRAGEVLDGPDLYDGPEERVLHLQEHAQLRLALSELPAPQRSLLELRILDGVPVAEVAARLGRTAGNVRVTQTRALQRLRQLLATQHTARDNATPALTPRPTRARFGPLSATLFTNHPYAALPRHDECPRCQARVQNGVCQWCGWIVTEVGTETRPGGPGSHSTVA